MLSVIIPVLNETAHLTRTLHSVQAAAGVEVIVVDGGSQDDTVSLARSLGAQVVVSAPGRAAQMNAGAAIAQGAILLFLHGDTCLPVDYDRWILATLKLPGVLVGAFELGIEGQERGLRWVEWGVKWRSRICQLPYGDQGLFLRAETFQQVGGFPQVPIMEDFVFVQAMKGRGRVAIAPVSVQTSSRRWKKLGILRTTMTNQVILLGYGLGVSPSRLAQWYRRLKGR
jgi:uncharacterized protein